MSGPLSTCWTARSARVRGGQVSDIVLVLPNEHVLLLLAVVAHRQPIHPVATDAGSRPEIQQQTQNRDLGPLPPHVKDFHV